MSAVPINSRSCSSLKTSNHFRSASELGSGAAAASPALRKVEGGWTMGLRYLGPTVQPARRLTMTTPLINRLFISAQANISCFIGSVFHGSLTLSGIFKFNSSAAERHLSLARRFNAGHRVIVRHSRGATVDLKHPPSLFLRIPLNRRSAT